MKIVFTNFALSIFICVVYSAPQNPEINDQFLNLNRTENSELKPEAPRHTEVEKLNEVDKLNEVGKLNEADNADGTTTTDQTTTIDQTNIGNVANNAKINVEVTEIEIKQEPTLFTKIIKSITIPIQKLMKAPKINTVMTNIGTCIVNGAMDIVSFYLPAPLIPLIASAAGLIIPFEPVVMLREKMPVTSYRRAFKTAIEGFLGTFDRYKYEEDDPYMTARFNRRFMGNSNEDNQRSKKINTGMETD